MVNAQSKQAALAVDFLKFMTNQDNAAEDDRRPRLAEPGQGVGDGAELLPAAAAARSPTSSKASQFAIWLDTVTNAEVANAYLSGVEGIIDGSQTPQHVMTGVQNAAAKAKKQAG